MVLVWQYTPHEFHKVTSLIKAKVLAKAMVDPTEKTGK